MEGLMIPCSSGAIALPFKQDSLSEFSYKPAKHKLHFNKTHESVAIKPDPGVREAHLSYLCKSGRLSEAINALDSIAQRGSKVRPNTFSRLIQSCIDEKSIRFGRTVHANIDLLEETDPFVGTKLVSMYAKCGSVRDARDVFDEMRERNLYTWSAMIGAYSRERRWREVIKLFFLMMKDDILPDDFLFPKILEACGNCGDIETGKLIHSIVIRCGMNSETRVNNSLLAVYAKCGDLNSMRRLFENMEEDIVSWNSVITGYCQKGDIGEAHRLFNLMHQEGIKPSLVTWNILITSCNKLGNCDSAMEMMKEMESFGITPDVFTWTSMISGFAQNNRRNQALELFVKMFFTGTKPNEITLMSAISACASLEALRNGKELHLVAVKMGFSGDVLVGNSLIDMYSKCGELEAAQQVFDTVLQKDVYTWNSIIGGYCQAGYCGKAHDLFLEMQKSYVPPNVITWNVMITGHMQNGDEDRAMDLFQRMEKDGNVKRNTASWNSLFTGYLQNGHKNKALVIFRQMQSSGVRPNSVTILGILPACANLVAVKKVKEIHGCVLRRSLDSELSVANSLLNTYAKSGNIGSAKAIFDKMSTRDIITWNTLIAGYVSCGCPHAALDLFDKMGKEGQKPNRGTFVSIISAYSLIGMVDEGKRIFSSMTEEYHILHGLEHCVAMVNLFGRSGRLEEAFEFIEGMAIEPDFSVWAALLTASGVHGNIRFAIHAGERLLKLEPGNDLIQQLVSRTQVLGRISDDSLKVRKPGKRNEDKESTDLSWIEIKNTVHTFGAGDQCKPNSQTLFSWIKGIEEKVQGTHCHDGLCLEEEEREEIEVVHSEKLAIAFAFIGCPQAAAQTIRIVKSLRMCGNCHVMAKFISKTYEREIYLRDSKCLHHFKNGQCSCGDYW